MEYELPEEITEMILENAKTISRPKGNINYGQIIWRDSYGNDK